MRRFLVLFQPANHFAANFADFAVEISHTGFIGIAVDDLLQRFAGERQLFRCQPVLIQMARDEKLVGDGDFLFINIAGKLDDFHTVEQGRGDGVGLVGGGDEQHLR